MGDWRVITEWSGLVRSSGDSGDDGDAAGPALGNEELGHRRHGFMDAIGAWG
jgi:hypothetical protein